MGTTEISAPAGVPFIDMSREFAASRELLFRAYSEMVVERWDVRDGGTWRYIHGDDAGNEYGFHGVFHGPQTVDGMVQTFEFEGAPGHVSLEWLHFEERGGRTLVRNHSVFQSVEDRDAMVAAGMAGGVSEGFDRLDELVDRLAVPARS